MRTSTASEPGITGPSPQSRSKLSTQVDEVARSGQGAVPYGIDREDEVPFGQELSWVTVVGVAVPAPGPSAHEGEASIRVHRERSRPGDVDRDGLPRVQVRHHLLALRKGLEVVENAFRVRVGDVDDGPGLMDVDVEPAR